MEEWLINQGKIYQKEEIYFWSKELRKINRKDIEKFIENLNTEIDLY